MQAHLPNSRPLAFTLIELLVVISIIALLIGILLPALAAARSSAQVTGCLSSQRQLAVGIYAYSGDYRGRIPQGSDFVCGLFGANWQGSTWAQIATNQTWTIGAWYGGPPGKVHGLGLLIDSSSYLQDPRIVFCPGDDTNDPEEELVKFKNKGEMAALEGTDDAFSSFFYRQLDQTTNDKIDDLGTNTAGFKARAWLIDANNTDLNPQYNRTNHKAKQVNIGYLDGHSQTVRDEANHFVLTDADNAGYPDMSNTMTALDRVLVRADFVEAGGSASDAPLP